MADKPEDSAVQIVGNVFSAIGDAFGFSPGAAPTSEDAAIDLQAARVEYDRQEAQARKEFLAREREAEARRRRTPRYMHAEQMSTQVRPSSCCRRCAFFWHIR
jgi:hypothetical protein